MSQPTVACHVTREGARITIALRQGARIAIWTLAPRGAGALAAALAQACGERDDWESECLLRGELAAKDGGGQ